jgi:hypothetical protein
MLKFWRNPEFVRHARAELRGPRAITAGLLALIVCALVGLASWAAEHEKLLEFFRFFHGWLVGLQFVFAGFWAASTCGQAISRERELKTYDFLKTTRLSPLEIMIGKVTGVPILAYFVVACTLPVSFLAGIWAGYSPLTLFAVYILLLALTLFVSLLGLTFSMGLEKSASAFVALLIILPMTGLYGLAESPFPGFGGFSILPALFERYGVGPASEFHKPTVFGLQTSYFIVTLILYAAFGAWMVVMLRRNLKREVEQIRLLSRWGAVGFAAFLNVIFYAFLDPKMLSVDFSYPLQPKVLSVMTVVLNGILLLLLGIAMLTPHERLKVWWRRRVAKEEGYFSEFGLPWPWLVLAATVAYGLLAAEAAGLAGTFGIKEWQLGRAALLLLVILVYSIRDVLFLQWCNVTRMKRPLMKGLLYLSLYYVAVSIIAAVAGVAGSKYAEGVFQVATPLGALLAEDKLGLRSSPLVFAGLIPQLFATYMVLKAIHQRISRPAVASSPSAAS